jgi:hypothetical protein
MRPTRPKWGAIPVSVVDGRLKVYGIEKLRIADGSIMPRVPAVAMSLCWCSNTDQSKASLRVRLLLALDGFLFEDIPRSGRLLSIWASAGAVIDGVVPDDLEE